MVCGPWLIARLCRIVRGSFLLGLSRTGRTRAAFFANLAICG
jgi:hypothetical protein